MLPFTGHEFQIPFFLRCDFSEQVGKDACSLAVFIHEYFGFVGVNPDTNFTHICHATAHQCNEQGKGIEQGGNYFRRLHGALL